MSAAKPGIPWTWTSPLKHHPPKKKTALIRVVSRNQHNEKQGYTARSVSHKPCQHLHFCFFGIFRIGGDSHVVCHCSCSNSQLRDSQPGCRSASVKMSFRTTRSPVCSNSKQFEICAPASSHSRALYDSPLMQTGYKLSQLRKSPPSSSFYLPIGRWMVEIRIPGETWDGENRNKDFPMSGTDVSFSTAFPFHPKGSCQTEGRRTRAHIIPFKRLPVLSHAISSARITMEFQDPAVTPL